ncbi:MAG: 6-phosphogluconolactonase, partial [Pirellulales bacterium]
MHSTLPPTYSQRERITCQVAPRADMASRNVAREIAGLIRERAESGATCVLGLATGSSPIGVYDEWVRMHREEGLSFQNVVTFNLDEYFPMRATELQSYHRFMREYLFDHIDIDPNQVHLPDGTIPEDAVQAYCQRY